MKIKITRNQLKRLLEMTIREAYVPTPDDVDLAVDLAYDLKDIALEVKQGKLDEAAAMLKAGLTDAYDLYLAMDGPGTVEAKITRVIAIHDNKNTIPKLAKDFQNVIMMLSEMGRIDYRDTGYHNLDEWLDADGMTREAELVRSKLGMNITPASSARKSVAPDLELSDEEWNRASNFPSWEGSGGWE